MGKLLFHAGKFLKNIAYLNSLYILDYIDGKLVAP